MPSGTKCVERTPIDGISIPVGSEASRKFPMPAAPPFAGDDVRVDELGAAGPLGPAVAVGPASVGAGGADAVGTALLTPTDAGCGGPGDPRRPSVSATIPTTIRTAVTARAAAAPGVIRLVMRWVTRRPLDDGRSGWSGIEPARSLRRASARGGRRRRRSRRPRAG